MPGDEEPGGDPRVEQAQRQALSREDLADRARDDRVDCGFAEEQAFELRCLTCGGEVGDLQVVRPETPGELAPVTAQRVIELLAAGQRAARLVDQPLGAETVGVRATIGPVRRPTPMIWR